MKKFWIAIGSGIIVIIGLIIALVVITTSEKDVTPPLWDKKPTDYVTAQALYGSLERIAESNSKLEVDQEHNKTYEFINTKQDDIIVSIGQVVSVDDLFFSHSNIRNEKLGRIETINFDSTNCIIVVSDFEYMICKIMIPQEKADDIEIGQDARILYNEKTFMGKLVAKDYVINDEGYLMAIVSVNQGHSMLLNAFVDVQVIQLSKDNVLRVPKEALIDSGNRFFVDVLNDATISRQEVKIGMIGSEYVEIKQGLSVGETVILNV